MDAFAEVKELEIALLDLRFSHTRVINQDRLLSLDVSLEARVFLASAFELMQGTCPRQCC